MDIPAHFAELFNPACYLTLTFEVLLFDFGNENTQARFPNGLGCSHYTLFYLSGNRVLQNNCQSRKEKAISVELRLSVCIVLQRCYLAVPLFNDLLHRL